MRRVTRKLIRLELLQLVRNKAFTGLMLLLFALTFLAAFNTYHYQISKKEEIFKQREIVKHADKQLIDQIDSLNQGLASYEDSYTLPTNGVRLTYNNHRITWLTFEPLSIIANGQGDIYSNYKKIVLYFNESYTMTTKELISPLKQLFGQLDLSFIWVYILPLIIILISFNVLSEEKETGRLLLVASQPITLFHWVLRRLTIRLLMIVSCIFLYTTASLSILQVSLFKNIEVFAQLILMLILYTAFWFSLSFLVNLLGYSSGKNLILLTNTWVLFVFVVPSAINQIGEVVNPVLSRLEIINHHQAVYNQVENNLEEELKGLFEIHPEWVSDDPATREMSNATGWNINYLAKQYIAQIKHQPVSEAYEQQIDSRNKWLRQFGVFSPAMILQESLADLAGTSTRYYRSFLRQAREYAQEYRWYVFQKLFTNHSFTSAEVRNLPVFKFENRRVSSSFFFDSMALLIYLFTLIAGSLLFINQTFNYHKYS
ncbi:MAG: DUF3526 domain-containing protein [Bacteroidota bacterium]